MTNTSVVIQLPEDINKLCRTCMKVADDGEDSFEHKIVLNNELTQLSKILESVTSLKIAAKDGLPETLCSQCNEYLNVAYLFKSHCESVDKDLRELVLLSDKTPSNSVIEPRDEKNEDTETDNVFVCQICVEPFRSNYELSMHLVEHNKSRSLSERFNDYHYETKPGITSVDNNIWDLILERKLYTLVDGQDTFNPSLKNGHNTTDSDSVESRAGSDIDEIEMPECETCGTIFQSEEEINSHNCELANNQHELADETDEETVFKCPLCSKNHSNAIALSIHFLKHAFTLDISTDPCFCEVCGQLFDNKTLLQEHYEQTTCEKEVWICSICNIVFETETLLLLHNSCHEEKTTTTNQGKVSCILCDESFLNKDNLATHTLTHLMKKYLCRECSISFCTQPAYFQHLKLHPGYQYTCIICGQLSKTKNALKCHVIGVHSERPAYSCKVCHKGFKTPGRLKTHSHIHDERKKYMCSYCGYTTHKSGDLQIHIRSHTSERPYKCTFAQCTMKFKTSSHLCSHLRRHLNIRNFTCSICNASFGTRHSLKVHHMLHTGEKPHNCNICGHNFRRKYHLKVHMKQHLPVTDNTADYS